MFNLDTLTVACYNKQPDHLKNFFNIVSPEVQAEMVAVLPNIVRSLLDKMSHSSEASKHYGALKRIIFFCLDAKNEEDGLFSDFKSGFQYNASLRHWSVRSFLRLLCYRSFVREQISGMMNAVIEIADLILANKTFDLNNIVTDYGMGLLNKAIYGFPAIVPTLLKHGADVNGQKEEEGPPVLRSCRAITSLYPHALQQQLNNCSSNSTSIQPISISMEYISPLMAAIIKFNQTKTDLCKNIMEVLIDDSDRDCLHSDLTPMMLAAYLGEEFVVALLLKNGYDINAINTRGRTPLSYAVQSQQKKVIAFLVNSGSSLIIKKPICDYIEESVRVNNLDYEGTVLNIADLFYCDADTASFLVGIEKQSKSCVDVAIKTNRFFMLPKGYHLTPQEVPADGDCLYHAVALHCPETASGLRSKVADLIKKGRFNDFLAGEEDPSIRAQRVREGVWGGQIEIQALMHILKRPIVIMYEQGALPTYPSNTNLFPGEPIFISYNGTNHYTGLVPKIGYTSNDIYRVVVPMMQFLHYRCPNDIVKHIMSFLSASFVVDKIYLSEVDRQPLDKCIADFINPPSKKRTSTLSQWSVFKKDDSDTDEDDDSSQKAKRTKVESAGVSVPSLFNSNSL